MTIKRIFQHINSCFLNLGEQGFIYGSQGKMLMKNIENHWYLHNVIMPRYNVFLTDNDKISSTLKNLKRVSIADLPYAFASLENTKVLWNHPLVPPDSKITSHKIARVATFGDVVSSKDLFHRKQRERKVWWRRLCRQPSRFIFEEAKKNKNTDIIEIKAQFPFGEIKVESIIYQHHLQKSFFEEGNQDNANKIQMVEHVVSLDWGCLALLCDSLEITNQRQMHLHPKLTPYKTTIFSIENENETESQTEELNRLILYLDNLLRTNGIGTILTKQNDIVQTYSVPYIITIDKTSLRTGIVHVVDRLTTLTQDVHINDLAKHIISRC